MSLNGCDCDFCAPTAEDKARARRIAAKILERHQLFDQWRKLDADDRPAFHVWADRIRSERRAHGVV